MPSKLKTAEDRVKLANRYTVKVGHVRVSRHMPEDTQRVYDALVAALKSMRDDTVRECCAAVRELCAECDEDGICGEEEGTSIECMHCGVPIRNIREKTGVKS